MRCCKQVQFAKQRIGSRGYTERRGGVRVCEDALPLSDFNLTKLMYAIPRLCGGASDDESSKCAACDEAMVVGLGSHLCALSTCKSNVHSWATCEKVWMPDEGVYFCCKEHLQQHNTADDPYPPKQPLRHRPDKEPESAELPNRKRKEPVTAASQRPRRTTTVSGKVTQPKATRPKAAGLPNIASFFNPPDTSKGPTAQGNRF